MGTVPAAAMRAHTVARSQPWFGNQVFTIRREFETLPVGRFPAGRAGAIASSARTCLAALVHGRQPVRALGGLLHATAHDVQDPDRTIHDPATQDLPTSAVTTTGQCMKSPVPLCTMQAAVPAGPEP